jgi:hypothetical protein
MRQINWSGMKWNVRSGQGGPGPNYWSDSIRNVWVDIYGRLHLKIVKYMGKWYCAEISTVSPVGLGNYIFNIYSNPANLANNVVGGMFYYLNDQNEIDIEFSRWEDPHAKNTQYTVWGPNGGVESPRGETNKANTSHIFKWSSNQIYFESTGILKWTYTGPYFPKTGGVLDLNLWLIDGKAPVNSQSQELVLSKIAYNQ